MAIIYVVEPLPALVNVMKEVVKAAEEGKPVLGVCNGFQILLEAGLLPGAMKRNESLKFICRQSKLRVENNQTMFTNQYEKDEIITIPIAHGEGNYYCDEETFAQLKKNNQIVFTYEGIIQMEVLKILQVLRMNKEMY